MTARKVVSLSPSLPVCLFQCLSVSVCESVASHSLQNWTEHWTLNWTKIRQRRRRRRRRGRGRQNEWTNKREQENAQVTESNADEGEVERRKKGNKWRQMLTHTTHTTHSHCWGAKCVFRRLCVCVWWNWICKAQLCKGWARCVLVWMKWMNKCENVCARAILNIFSFSSSFSAVFTDVETNGMQIDNRNNRNGITSLLLLQLLCTVVGVAKCVIVQHCRNRQIF